MCCCLNGCVTLSNIVRCKGCQISTFYTLIFKIECNFFLFIMFFYFLFIAINFTVINPHCIFGCQYLIKLLRLRMTQLYEGSCSSNWTIKLLNYNDLNY